MALLAGCAHRSEAPAAGAAAVDIKADNTLALIDGGGWLGWRKRIDVPAGEHEALLMYHGSGGASTGSGSTYRIKLVLAEGRSYTIRSDVFSAGAWEKVKSKTLSDVPERARLWVEDSATGERVGELVESFNEPVDSDTRFEVPGSFVWAPEWDPAGKYVSRSTSSLTVKWYERPGREARRIVIAVRDVPALASAEALAEHVGQALAQARSRPGTDVLETLEQSVSTEAARAGVCVRYHHVVNERALHQGPGALPPNSFDGLSGLEALVAAAGVAVLPLLHGQRQLVEAVGYFCRAPGAPGRAVDFRYDHLTLDNDRDPDLSAQAERHFSRLRF